MCSVVLWGWCPCSQDSARSCEELEACSVKMKSGTFYVLKSKVSTDHMQTAICSRGLAKIGCVFIGMVKSTSLTQQSSLCPEAGGCKSFPKRRLVFAYVKNSVSAFSLASFSETV